MLSTNDLRYTLALQKIPNLGDISAKKLLRKLGSAEAIFKEKKSSLAKIDGIGAVKLKDLNLKQQLEQADEEIVDGHVQGDGGHNVIGFPAVNNLTGLPKDQPTHQQYEHG